MRKSLIIAAGVFLVLNVAVYYVALANKDSPSKSGRGSSKAASTRSHNNNVVDIAASDLVVFPVGASMDDISNGIIVRGARSVLQEGDIDSFPSLLASISRSTRRDVVQLVDSLGQSLDLTQEIPQQVYGLRNGDLFVYPSTARKMQIELPQIGVRTIQLMSDAPRVLRVQNFLSPAECDWLIEKGRERMGPSKMSRFGRKNDAFVRESDRTSSTAWLHHDEEEFQALRERISALVHVKISHFEDFQVVRYAPMQHYHAHHDYHDPADLSDEILKKVYSKVNRFVTVLFYLTDGFDGGETAFPLAGDSRPVSEKELESCNRGLRVAPEKGTAVIFYGMTAEGHRDGELDPMSLHAGCDVSSSDADVDEDEDENAFKKREKWIANVWIANKEMSEYFPAWRRLKELKNDKGNK